MCRNLACRSAAIYQSPHNLIVFACFINSDYTNWVFGIILDILKILSAAGYDKVLSAKIRYGNTFSDFFPFSIEIKILLV